MDIDGLFFRAEALTLGFTDSSLRRARLSGELIAVRPGAYVTARYFHSLDSPQQHLLLARAMSDGTVLSHVSAAIAWGMDVWGLPLARVHLTTGRPITTRTTRRRTVHGTRLAPADFTTHDGLTLTTPARTVVDIARTATHTQAVCTGDSALRRGLVTAKALSEAVAAAKYRTGTPGAVRAVEAMTNRSDSVGESRSRLILQDQNLPVPLLNQSVFDPDGTFLGRVDFLFAELGVIGEFDGSGKYGESGAAVRKNLVAEKYREDRLRDAGWIVVRWGWADLADPSALQDRVRRALARGARAPQPRTQPGTPPHRRGIRSALRYVQGSMDFELPSMFSRSEALASGFTDDDLRRARADGELYTVRRGYFVRTEVYRTLDSGARHLVLARAIHAESSRSVVFSHVSAAVLHGMQLWELPLDKATFTVARTYAGKRGRQRILRVAPIPPTELMEVAGLPVTTPARTVVDLARSLPMVPAVCLGDCALRLGLTHRDELGELLSGARTRTGIAKARRAVGLMSDGSDSAGESRSRLHLHALPLPPPLVGQWVYDDDGVLIGRASFLYPDHGVIGEFEGGGEFGAEPVLPSLDDRRRHNRMQELDWTVVRWNWRDLSSPRALTDRIARAFLLASAKRAPAGTFSAARG